MQICIKYQENKKWSFGINENYPCHGEEAIWVYLVSTHVRYGLVLPFNKLSPSRRDIWYVNGTAYYGVWGRNIKKVHQMVFSSIRTQMIARYFLLHFIPSTHKPDIQFISKEHFKTYFMFYLPFIVFSYVYVCACICVNIAMYVGVYTETKRGCLILWSWRNRQLWGT